MYYRERKICHHVLRLFINIMRVCRPLKLTKKYYNMYDNRKYISKYQYSFYNKYKEFTATRNNYYNNI